MRKRFDYAIALLGSLREQGGTFAGVGTIAEALGLPRAYLEKVAQELKQAGWLESRKGPYGGYRLSKDGGQVSVEALINFYSPIQQFCPVLREMEK
ncbi:MAG: Rrf2 family transcriptional regulator [Candidatus Sungbacteria bacterium]|uniref:Rrf2 family transcriptional regulator n=1 Tax=Candidatus Sungiibacteriota bacterium TaxID=2750080 RepID=A0A932YY62_9BACT|nr:Rrf2 family transcriptional regulator [Candidatus Sungbacteria bacterium]